MGYKQGRSMIKINVGGGGGIVFGTIALLNFISPNFLIVSKLFLHCGTRSSGLMLSQSKPLHDSSLKSNLILAVIGVNLPIKSKASAARDVQLRRVNFSGKIPLKFSDVFPDDFTEIQFT